MSSPLAVFHVKPWHTQPPMLPVAAPPLSDTAFSFELDLAHQVWLAKFSADLDEVEWDTYEPSLCLPDLWQSSWLSSIDSHGQWTSSDLLAGRLGPLPGDRVVVHRTAPFRDIVGVWLVTGVKFGSDGSVHYGHRPLVSCLEPIKLKPALQFDADLVESWDTTFGRRSRSQGRLLPLAGAALSAVIRTVGIDPRLMCGPTEDLPDCSLSNREPARGFRPATRLSTRLSDASMLDARAVVEAVDWMLSPEGCGFADVEVVAHSGRGVSLVARGGANDADRVTEVVVIGSDAVTVDDLVVCPTVVLDALDAVATGRDWHLVVTLSSPGRQRTLRFEALAVSTCFDPASGRVAA